MDRRLSPDIPVKAIVIFLFFSLPFVPACSSFRAPPGTGGDVRSDKQIDLKRPGLMVLIRSTGAYYAPESDEDIFMFGGKWYFFAGDEWFESGSYRGPWEEIPPAFLPDAIRNIPEDKYKNEPPRFKKS